MASNGQISLDMVIKRFQEATCCKYFKLIILDIDMPIMDGI
jgi:hypothetical protein